MKLNYESTQKQQLQKQQQQHKNKTQQQKKMMKKKFRQACRQTGTPERSYYSYKLVQTL